MAGLIEDKKDETNIRTFYRRKGTELPDYMTIACLVVGMIALFTEVCRFLCVSYLICFVF